MKRVKIGNRFVGEGEPCFIVAELSANHNGSISRAKKIIRLAKQAGADAVKIQTYMPETLTLDCNNKYFKIQSGQWKGQSLYELYTRAYMPWEWQPKLLAYANGLGIMLFSTPFDKSAVDFLSDRLDPPAYKIASFEIVDTPLIEYAARKKKPMIISTGMANEKEIQYALDACSTAGNRQVVLLKCLSDYPAKPEEMNLSVIPVMKKRFGLPVGLSDHSMFNEVALGAVSLGSCMIEKHFTDKRSAGGPDSGFSMEPEEFQAMVQSIRILEKSLGQSVLALSASEQKNRVFRRSLFCVKEIRKGERLSYDNIRSVRPGYGIPVYEIEKVIGKKTLKNVKFGMPITRQVVGVR